MIRRFLSFLLLVLVGLSSGRAAIDIQFDYTYDSTGFFSGENEGRRSLLEAAANVFESRMLEEIFTSMIPSGFNEWQWHLDHPGTGADLIIDNPSLPANTIRIYVGARQLGASQLGVAQYGYGYSGTSAWADRFEARDSLDNYDPFGGAISFDIDSNWYFDADPFSLESFAGQYDFYSVAQHEIAHILGFTSGADAYTARVQNGHFIGASARGIIGPNGVPLHTDNTHIQNGFLFQGRELAMDPSIAPNVRKNFSELEFAMLEDIGYLINPIPEPSTALVLVAAAGILIARRRRG